MTVGLSRLNASAKMSKNKNKSRLQNRDFGAEKIMAKNDKHFGLKNALRAVSPEPMKHRIIRKLIMASHYKISYNRNLALGVSKSPGFPWLISPVAFSASEGMSKNNKYF